MRRKIELYIDGRLADIEKQDLILMTYALTDLQKPSAVKNSYSKQVTLPGTPTNDAIFSHAYRVDRRVTAATFNPLTRTPFVIMDELGEVLQSGYLKLDRVERKKDIHSYAVTLYGGLGSFFYDLTYNGDGEKLSLADLTYKVADADFKFPITKGTIVSAWSRLDDGESGLPLWDIINFAPCYNGLPDKFDANKARMQDDYDTVVELSRKYSEWETHDLRSYLQRPAINVAEVLDAINTYAEALGKTVEWDAEFFSSGNPYYNKTWMLLPMLTKYNNDSAGQVGEASSVWAEHRHNATAETAMESAVYVDGETFASENDGHIDFSSFDPSYYLSGNVQARLAPSSMNGFLNYWDAVNRKWVGTLVGIVATVRIGSGARPLYFRSKPCIYGKWNDTGDTRLASLLRDLGTDDFISAGNEISLASPPVQFNFPSVQIVASDDVTVLLQTYTYSDNAQQGDTVFRVYADEQSDNNSAQENLWVMSTGGSFALYAPASVESGGVVTKAMLLSDTCTPADFLLSFCRQFGLRIVETAPDKIAILSPNAFYTGAIDDLTKRIDCGSTKVVPLTFNKKWQKLGISLVQSTAAKEYKKLYGKEYGVLNLDTGLEFNADTQDLMAGSAFKGGISGKWSAPTLFDFRDVLYHPVNPALVAGYKVGSATTYPQIYDRLPLNADHPGYDITTKPFGFTKEQDEQKAVDLTGMLVFFNGIEQNPGNYWLTDDYPYTEDNPCWLMPIEADDYADEVTILPIFSRYYEGAEGVVLRSLDFGTPAEVYDPDITLGPDSSIYTRFWKEYLGDLYDASGKVMTAKVHFNGIKVGPALFRRFYFYEGSIWVLNKISNYSLTTYDPVECEFVQVQDKSAYTAGQTIIDQEPEQEPEIEE